MRSNATQSAEADRGPTAAGARVQMTTAMDRARKKFDFFDSDANGRIEGDEVEALAR
jgi:hypothetical protein